ncbi:ParB N-terminal domain-containing protein [Streptomyces sp. NRRL B-24484]|uniref:ParB N-terminal domain-containing protein n=1 Tax=Streptomyces sp. NRRL B-24484 TaxID=1463833 RepID=UPI000694BE7B|nr:ParB N-terminal domain-containing protein [Streptomyces sp. NRRL B-24484]
MPGSVLVPGTAVVGGEHDLGKLAEAITAVGLLHPVVVTANLDLPAGGRHLALACFLGWTEVPVTVVDLTTAEEVLRAEWEENTCRNATFAAGGELCPGIRQNKGGRPPKGGPGSS